MLIATLLAAAIAIPAAAQTPPAPPVAAPTAGLQVAQPAARAGDYPYLLFLPRGYDADRSQRWPLMIFLHGSGERGADLSRVATWGPPKVIAAHPGTPMLIVSPQAPDGADWDVATLERLLADIRKRYRVDASRIYLTGLSLGGIASWRWAIARPDLFAALAPVAAETPIRRACLLKDMPIWAFHGDDDGAVPVRGDFEMVEAVRACKGSVKPRLTVYPATDHFSWVPAYDDPGFWRWIGEQRRAVPAP